MNEGDKKINKIAIGIVIVLLAIVIVAIIVDPVFTISFLIGLMIILWWISPSGWGMTGWWFV